MKTYMATYNEEHRLAEKEWKVYEHTVNTLFIFAENDAEAQERFDAALAKLNQYAPNNVRYVSATEPKGIIAMSVSRDLVRGTTAVNGLWE